MDSSPAIREDFSFAPTPHRLGSFRKLLRRSGLLHHADSSPGAFSVNTIQPRVATAVIRKLRKLTLACQDVSDWSEAVLTAMCAYTEEYARRQRDAVLEEAAMVADATDSSNFISSKGYDWNLGVNDASLGIAERIRALKESGK